MLLMTRHCRPGCGSRVTLREAPSITRMHMYLREPSMRSGDATPKIGAPQ